MTSSKKISFSTITTTNSANNNNNDNNDKNTENDATTLLDEMTNAMALSMLIFLFADMRLMSATGRIRTTFQTIAVDSDMVLKASAANLAGLVDHHVHKHYHHHHGTDSSNHPLQNAATSSLSTEHAAEQNCPLSSNYKPLNQGISPAQLMAVVLIEMKRSMDEQKKKIQEEANNNNNNNRNNNNNDDDEEDDGENAMATNDLQFDHDDFQTFATTRPIPRRTKARKKGIKEDSMHTLLKAYAQMIDADRIDQIQPIPARRSYMHLLVDPSKSLGESHDQIDDENSNQPAAAAEDASESKNSQQPDDVPKQQQQQSNTVSEDDEGHDIPLESIEVPVDDSVIQLQASSSIQSNSLDAAALPPPQQQQESSNHRSGSRRRMLLERVPENRQLLRRANEAARAMLQTEDERAQKHMESVTDALFQMGEKNESFRTSVSNSSGDNNINNNTNNNRTLSDEELLRIMTRAVESRDHGKLDFMSGFFRTGTISQLMVKSKARIVWINDWYPVKDLTYVIAVDTDRRRVLVVFRGAITKQDWSKALDFELRKVDNPITEDFEGKAKRIGISNGFHQYLFRVRKDTGTTKYDEIANIAHKYGLDRIGEDYTLAVVGHSLGAALSTVFSLYASADDRFTRNGPVKVFTFGSPYVGGHTFADSYRHQEQTGRLMHARFYNHNDVVAYVPANMQVTKRGSKYRHVGIGIKIPPVPIFFSGQRKWSPHVSYVGKEGFWASYCRGIGRNFLLHSPAPWKIPQMHTLAELQKRMILGRSRKDSQVGKKYQLLHKSIEELYKELVLD